MLFRQRTCSESNQYRRRHGQRMFATVPALSQDPIQCQSCTEWREKIKRRDRETYLSCQLILETLIWFESISLHVRRKVLYRFPHKVSLQNIPRRFFQNLCKVFHVVRRGYNKTVHMHRCKVFDDSGQANLGCERSGFDYGVWIVVFLVIVRCLLILP